MPIQPEEARIIRGLISGDEPSVATLVQRYEPVMRAAFRLQGIPEHDHDDLLQEVVTTALSQIKRQMFRGESSLGTWLATIARGKAIDRKRSAAGRQGQITASLDTGSGAVLARLEHAVAPREDLVLAVRQTLARLESADRALLKLCEMEGYSVKEVAASSGLPEKRVYRLLSAARERFRLEFLGKTAAPPRLIE